jgi:hypothetical protein
MSARTDLLLWAQRVVARKAAPPYMILEIAANAGLDVAQEAFHKIARMAHPDLHRVALTPEELELVTTAYARAAAAYHQIRSQRASSSGASVNRGPVASGGSGKAAVRPEDALPVNPASAMTSRALIYYRKAELCLRRGDLTGAMLQLRMAIASDPQSSLLRSALAEVQAEVGKKP